MAKNIKERLAFKFYKSYLEVYNELESAEDKVAFLDLIFHKQFTGEDPDLSKVNSIVRLCYKSQKHSIDKQVSGYLFGGSWKDKESPPKGTYEGNPDVPSVQEQEQEQEQVQVQEKLKEQEQKKEKEEVKEEYQVQGCNPYFPSLDD